MFKQIYAQRHRPYLLALILGLFIAAIYASTLQIHINGDTGPYTIDVGEIQNALPRWGTLHPFGYPLYSILGSLQVSILDVLGVAPATAASSVSLIWGAGSVVMLFYIALKLDADPIAALIGSLIFGLSRSIWVVSSIAEVHTFTMFLTTLVILFTLRYAEAGRRGDLYWIGFVAASGVVHSRSVAFMAPAVFLIIGRHWREILRNIHWLLLTGIAGLSFYLYMPIREMMGAKWIFFKETTTWSGFSNMLFHVKSEDILLGETWSEWQLLIEKSIGLLIDDLTLPFLIIGLIGIFFYKGKGNNTTNSWTIRFGLTLIWVPYALMSVILWRENLVVHDALLAIKLPVSMMAGLGFAFVITRMEATKLYYPAIIISLVGVGWAGQKSYPLIQDITTNRQIESTIAMANRTSNSDRPVALYSLWGNSYWGLAYAQEYREELIDVTLLNDRSTPKQLWSDKYDILFLREVFYHPMPVSPSPRYVDTFAPGIIEWRETLRFEALPYEHDPYQVNDDLEIAYASLHKDGDEWLLTIQWRATKQPKRNYSIAVHLLANNPPSGPQDLLDQDDKQNPVEGLYPTSEWHVGQVVQDVYLVEIPEDTNPIGVRITAYYVDEDGQFVNGEWIFFE